MTNEPKEANLLCSIGGFSGKVAFEIVKAFPSMYSSRCHPRYHLIYHSIMAIMVALAAFLSLGTATFAAAAISHETGDHCGLPPEPTGHSGNHATHASERHELLTGTHASVEPQSAAIDHADANQCPLGSGLASGEQGHQCGHHAPPAGASDVPSLYCNCHSKHTDGRAAQPTQEYTGLASQASPFDALIQPGIVLSSVNPLPQRLFLDPVEKPPTIS